MIAHTLFSPLLPAAPMSLGIRPRQFLGHLRRRVRTAPAQARVAGVTLSLQSNQLLNVRHPQGCAVRCLEGRLWLTFEACAADVFLEPGDSLHCGTHEGLLIQALKPARCVIE